MRFHALRRASRLVLASLLALSSSALAHAAPPNEVGAWEKKQPAHAPSPRSSHRMTYDRARQRVVLFGGGTPADTWEWDGTDWLDKTPPAPAKSPDARIDPALAYDPVRQRVILFGGGVGLASANDTWEWDGTSWVERAPAHKPTARESASMVFDEARGVAVLFGGLRYGIGNVDETWTWNGTDWTQRSVAGAKPGPRQQLRLAYDAKRQRVVLYGGRNWEGAVLGDTWEWNGSAWQERTPGTTPGPRRTFGLASSGGRGKVVLFGGTNADGDATGETWEWNGTTWAQPSLVGSGPSARSTTALVYDEAHHEYVAFGRAPFEEGGAVDTWVYRSAGGACSDVGACDAAACSDGVCCDRTCTGSCEACNLAGSVGTCSLATGEAVAGHPVCAGTGPCSGQCDGTSAACTYPTSTTSCGAPTCIDGIATSYGCDGAGLCKTETGSCADAGETDAGTGAPPGDGGSSFAAPDASPKGGEADAEDIADSESGCACRSTDTKGRDLAGAVLIALGVVVLRRRRG